MKVTETISSNPIPTEPSVRGEEVRVLTSCRAGKIVPVSYIPLLREDRVSRGSIRLRLEMAETVHPLMNAVNVTAFAHFIPFLAFERFSGMDAFNRSYQGVNEPNTSAPIPFFKTVKFKGSDEFWSKLGVHWPEGADINSAPLEAYNLLVNFRRNARSAKLSQRELYLSSYLAGAFWKNPNMYHIVPDFDQAMMDGEVELSWTNPRAPISGLGSVGNRTRGAKATVMEPSGNLVEYSNSHTVLAANNALSYRQSATGTLAPQIFAELAESGVRLSLANIDLAKKTAAFAKLRSQYQGLDDEHIVDLLMEGIRVPDEALRQPILLDRKSTIFGYTERHATDGASLDKSVTTGQTELTLNFRTPPMNTGGIILITVEIVPEQLFERMNDHFLGVKEPDVLPNFLRDFLDPEKVSVVQNRHVDVHHSLPDGTFGYAPLNHEWKRSLTRIGGRYRRPLTDGFVEDRQRFWSVEQKDPKLTSDFYLVNELPHSVFADTTADPFEILALGNVEIIGNTVFGQVLDEDRGDYDAVMSEVDTQRVVQGA